MPIAVDHVFVCCDEGAPEARALLDIGLVEGAGNTHPGQGTANRRFFFAGGFIELLWVADKMEVQSEQTARTRLWERWSGRHSGVSPFGIAFSPTGSEVQAPPFSAWPYRPEYLPADKIIYFAEGTTLREPELFYLAWPNPRASVADQPKDHQVPLFELVSVAVGISGSDTQSGTLEAASRGGVLSYYRSRAPELTIFFRSNGPCEYDLRSSLGLLLKGTA